MDRQEWKNEYSIRDARKMYVQYSSKWTLFLSIAQGKRQTVGSLIVYDSSIVYITVAEAADVNVLLFQLSKYEGYIKLML